MNAFEVILMLLSTFVKQICHNWTKMRQFRISCFSSPHHRWSASPCHKYMDLIMVNNFDNHVYRNPARKEQLTKTSWTPESSTNVSLCTWTRVRDQNFKEQRMGPIMLKTWNSILSFSIREAPRHGPVYNTRLVSFSELEWGSLQWSSGQW